MRRARRWQRRSLSRSRETSVKYLSAILLAGVTAFAQPPSDGQLDRIVAAGKSQRELAQYVFDTHGCKGCHTIGADGKLGFTDKGKQRAKGFEGCISMLTSMTAIVQVPEEK